jgi:hypothetical protein
MMHGSSKFKKKKTGEGLLDSISGHIGPYLKGQAVQEDHLTADR